MAAAVLGVSGSLSVSAEDTPPETPAPAAEAASHITVVSTPAEVQPDCATAANLNATGAVYNGGSKWIYTINAKAPICEPVTAAIYTMPNNIFWPWPQQKAEAVTFEVPAGTTVVTFTKDACAAQQFDIVTGETPDRIQPTTGPMHGPLLFLNPYSAIQNFPTGTCASTTTTTVAGVTTTVVAPSTTEAPTTTTTAEVEGVTTTVVTTEAPTTTVADVPTSVMDVTTVPATNSPSNVGREVQAESLPRTGFGGQRLLVIAVGCILLGAAATRIARIRSKA